MKDRQTDGKKVRKNGKKGRRNSETKRDTKKDMMEVINTNKGAIINKQVDKLPHKGNKEKKK